MLTILKKCSSMKSQPHSNYFIVQVNMTFQSKNFTKFVITFLIQWFWSRHNLVKLLVDIQHCNGNRIKNNGWLTKIKILSFFLCHQMKDMILICHNLPYHATVKKDQFLDVVIFALLTNLTRKNHQLSFQSVIISTKNIIEATKHVLFLRVIQKVNTEQNNGKFLKYSLNDRNDKHIFFYLINFFFSSSTIKEVI